MQPTSNSPTSSPRPTRSRVRVIVVSLAAFVFLVGGPIFALARHDLDAEQTMGMQSRAFERRQSELAVQDARFHRCPKAKNPGEVRRCGDKSAPFDAKGATGGDHEVLKSFKKRPIGADLDSLRREPLKPAD